MVNFEKIRKFANTYFTQIRALWRHNTLLSRLSNESSYRLTLSIFTSQNPSFSSVAPLLILDKFMYVFACQTSPYQKIGSRNSKFQNLFWIYWAKTWGKKLGRHLLGRFQQATMQLLKPYFFAFNQADPNQQFLRNLATSVFGVQESATIQTFIMTAFWRKL